MAANWMMPLLFPERTYPVRRYLDHLGDEMLYEENSEIKAALEELHRWLRVEGDPPKPAALARELVKISGSGGVARRNVLTAAFSLHAVGLPATAGNVAWLVRDDSIGFPDEPTFDF